jgi:hypothetical protein
MLPRRHTFHYSNKRLICQKILSAAGKKTPARLLPRQKPCGQWQKRNGKPRLDSLPPREASENEMNDYRQPRV